MSECNPTAPVEPVKTAKPNKPSRDFPLFPHARGQWVKETRGKRHYFGLWADPDAALSSDPAQKPATTGDRDEALKSGTR